MLSSRAAGQARPDAEIPVDVHYAKLASWLVDRKKAPADWRKRLAAIEAASKWLASAHQTHPHQRPHPVTRRRRR